MATKYDDMKLLYTLVLWTKSQEIEKNQDRMVISAHLNILIEPQPL